MPRKNNRLRLRRVRPEPVEPELRYDAWTLELLARDLVKRGLCSEAILEPGAARRDRPRREEPTCAR